MMYVIYALLILILAQEIIHRAERKDLYNRIMCRDIDDYKHLGEPKADKAPSAHDRALKKWRSKGKNDKRGE